MPVAIKARFGGASRRTVGPPPPPPPGGTMTPEEAAALQPVFWNVDAQMANDGQLANFVHEGAAVRNSLKFRLLAAGQDWPANREVAGHPGWLMRRQAPGDASSPKIAASVLEIARDGGMAISLMALMHGLTGELYWLEKMWEMSEILRPELSYDWHPQRYHNATLKQDKGHNRMTFLYYRAEGALGTELAKESGTYWGNDTKRLELGLIVGDIACMVYTLDRYSNLHPKYLSARNFWRDYLFNHLIHVLRFYNDKTVAVPKSVDYPAEVRAFWRLRSQESPAQAPRSEYNFIDWFLLHEGYSVMRAQHYLYLLTGDAGYAVARDDTRDTIRRGTYLYGPSSWGFRAHAGLQLPKNAPGTSSHKWYRRLFYINNEAIGNIDLLFVHGYNVFGAGPEDARGYVRGIARYGMDVAPADVTSFSHPMAGDAVGGYHATANRGSLSRSEAGQRWTSGSNYIAETLPGAMGSRQPRPIMATWSTALLEMFADNAESLTFQAHGGAATSAGTDRQWFRAVYDGVEEAERNAAFAEKPNHLFLALRPYFRLRLARGL